MECGEKTYIWQADDWPHWRYDLSALAGPLAEVSHAQGRVLGRMADAGMALRDQACLTTLTEDVLRTSEIEGEVLNQASVRSSLARRLGVEVGALAPVDRHVEGVVDMVLDAASQAHLPLSAERLFGWHAALFPTGFSGLSRIAVGQWRTDSDGPMQVVSGPVGRQKLHFQAPPAHVLAGEMARFFAWANVQTDSQTNGPSPEPPLIKAGLAHLWFVTLHPFEDGNGRMARAVGDLFLTRADGQSQRFYSLSAQIQRERQDYYAVLERSQQGSLDVTDWLLWFLAALGRALASAQLTLDAVLRKSRLWQRWAGLPLNPRQAKLLNRLLDGFEGRLTSSKWAAIAKCSADTALRDINQLLELGVLKKASGGGRSTAYEVVG